MIYKTCQIRLHCRSFYLSESSNFAILFAQMETLSNEIVCVRVNQHKQNVLIRYRRCTSFSWIGIGADDTGKNVDAVNQFYTPKSIYSSNIFPTNDIQSLRAIKIREIRIHGHPTQIRTRFQVYNNSEHLEQVYLLRSHQKATSFPMCRNSVWKRGCVLEEKATTKETQPPTPRYRNTDMDGNKAHDNKQPKNNDTREEE